MAEDAVNNLGLMDISGRCTVKSHVLRVAGQYSFSKLVVISVL